MHRKTNTGTLAVELLGDSVEVILWERTKPNTKLLAYIKEGDIALLYPHEKSETLCEESSYKAYILIDSTWQEAQKIYNKSPYLQALPSVAIQTDTSSQYTLRRNQKAYGLCTAEIVCELLKHNSQCELAEALEGKLHSFINHKPMIK